MMRDHSPEVTIQGTHPFTQKGGMEQKHMKEKSKMSGEAGLWEAPKLSTTRSTSRRSFFGRPPKIPVASKFLRARSAETKKQPFEYATTSTFDNFVYGQSYEKKGDVLVDHPSGLLRRPWGFKKSNSFQTSRVDGRLSQHQVPTNTSYIGKVNIGESTATRSRLKHGLQTKNYSFKGQPGSRSTTSRRGVKILPSLDKPADDSAKNVTICPPVDEVSCTSNPTGEMELSVEYCHRSIEKTNQADGMIQGLDKRSTRTSSSNSAHGLSLNFESESSSMLTGDSPSLVWKAAAKFDLIRIRCRSDSISSNSRSWSERIPDEIDIVCEEDSTSPQNKISDVYGPLIEEEVETTTNISFLPNLSANTAGSSIVTSKRSDNDSIECSIESLNARQNGEEAFLHSGMHSESNKSSDTISTDPISSLSTRSRDSKPERNDEGHMDEWKHTGSESSIMENSILAPNSVSSRRIVSKKLLTISDDVASVSVEELAKTLKEEFAALKGHNEKLILQISTVPRQETANTTQGSRHTAKVVPQEDLGNQNDLPITCSGILDWGAVDEIVSLFWNTSFTVNAADNEGSPKRKQP